MPIDSNMCPLGFSRQRTNELIPVQKHVKHVNLLWHSNAPNSLINTQTSTYFIQLHLHSHTAIRQGAKALNE